jgi:type II secretory pathway pseudopilin PulG
VSSRSAGFTLLEVLLMVILGIILASVAMPSAHTFDDQRVASAARILGSDIEFARARALATSLHHRILVELHLDRYKVESPVGTPLLEPLTRKPWIRELATHGIDITATDFNGFTALVFDPSGKPNSGGSFTFQKGTFRAVIKVAAVTGEVTLELP